MKRISGAVWLLTLILCAPAMHAAAQAVCNGSTLNGVVRDSTAAIIPGAAVVLDGGKPSTADSAGLFHLRCVRPGRHTLHITSASFAALDLNVTTPHAGDLNAVLQPSAVDMSVQVVAEESGANIATSTTVGPSQTISGQGLQSLADDPDDLLRELQQLAAAAGGSPSGATVGVDGFAGNGEGGSTLPPKSSIAYIKVNPDVFSAEYRNPPFGGGEIQIYTKPGQPVFHGALFATNSSSWMNARDPFSTANVALGKQRYGFELSGPIRKKGSDFTLTLEHRSIDNDATVEAQLPDANGNPVAFSQTVAAPQRLWVGLARSDWQLGAKNTFIASYNASVNHKVNVGVGGNTLAQAGYDSENYDHVIHLTDVTAISAKLMHELRVGFEWDGEDDTPYSTTPQVSVAGAFTGGGASVGPRQLHELYTTVDDDIILTTSRHLLKVGVQLESPWRHMYLSNNFNGSYIFSGTATQTALQQYATASAPTDFSNVAGDPAFRFAQARFAAYVQDDWKLRDNLHLAYGIRSYEQDEPTVSGKFQPRVGIIWTPDKKATWSLHGHAGIFADKLNSLNWAELVRENGVQRITSTVYNPSAYCPSGVTNACNPFAGATTINSLRTIAPGFSDELFAIENLGLTHTFPYGFTLSADYMQAQIWHASRSENINSPLNGLPTGPRPGAANTDVLQLQNSGRGFGTAQFVGLSQQSFKRLTFFAGVFHNDIRDDTDDTLFSTPQTTGINSGEYARRSGNGLWNIFGNALLTLPEKIKLSTNINGSGHELYNVTTGNDNNGDGDFNDRPRYAPAGTPLCATSPTANPCAYNTRWGLLTNYGNGPTLARNQGVMPWTVYMDVNLQRSFLLTRDPKAAHQQMLSANIRSSNVLNHENITSVGGVLGSPLFGVAYAADPGRRIEGGLRYSF